LLEEFCIKIYFVIFIPDCMMFKDGLLSSSGSIDFELLFYYFHHQILYPKERCHHHHHHHHYHLEEYIKLELKVSL